MSAMQSERQQSERLGQPGTGGAPLRFRAATVEEALQQARASLGEDAEIVEANRIRRGGIGGFFATELGVEVIALGTADVGTPDVTHAPEVIAPAITEPTRSPIRARQAWRRAIDERPIAAAAHADDADDAEHAHHADAQPMMPGFEAMLAEAARIERNDGPVPVAPDDAASDPHPTTFAEHFLRELVHDAQQLRGGTDRNRELPPSPRTLADGSLMPHTADAGEPPVAPRRRVMLSATATQPIVAPDILDGAPVLAATTRPTDSRSQSGKRRAGTSASKRAPRTDPAESAPELPFEPNTTDSASPAVAAGALTALVEGCLQFATTADRETAPRKVALAVTLADGGVMKMTLELPRSR